MKQLLHYCILSFLIIMPAASTAQVTKLSNNTNIRFGIPFNGKFLMADSSGSLWTTDGTAVNTVIYTTKVKFDMLGGIAIINNKLYFSGVSTADGSELWVTDGTDAGTSLVKDINAGVDSSSPKHFNVINNVIYFSANDGTHGNELWKSDGTSGGTAMVKDINPGAAGSLDSATFFLNNSMLFFTANDGTHGYELWRSDGSLGGTILLKDIVAGSGEPYFGPLTSFGTKTIFDVVVGGLILGNSELWISDGTSGGTTLIKDFGSFSGTPTFGYTKFNNKIYFDGTQSLSTGTELWVTDGTTGGTNIVKDIYPGINSSLPFLTTSVNFTGNFMFTATTGTSGTELWLSDGTGTGTTLMDDINPGSASSNAIALIGFSAFGQTSSTLYKGKIFVSANDGTHGTELWITDGTKANTSMVKDIQPGSGGSLTGTTGYFYTAQGLYFSANDGSHGLELWTSDGTSGGTTLVKDINPGSNGSSPEFMGIFNNHLYFTADDGDNTSGKRDLYIVDATTTTLPVSLASFTAVPVKNDVQLNWSTSTEINTSHFNIQKSEDGSSFINIGTVKAAGNSSITQNYQYIDVNAMSANASVLYYRLQTNDNDGNVTYSRIISIPVKEESVSVAIYPNPARAAIQLTYTLPNANVPQSTVRIINSEGKIVLSSQLGNVQGSNKATLDISSLAAGVYYVQVITGKNVKNTRFVKQ